MSEFEKWLRKMVTDIENGIRKARGYGYYVDEVICNNDRFYIWKRSGKDETKEEKNSTTVIIAPPKTEVVNPVPIRLRLQNNWRYSFEDSVHIVLNRVFINFVSREEKAITSTFTKDEKIFEVNSNIMSRNNLQDAISYIYSQDNFADTLLINPLQMPKLMQEKGFISRWTLPPQLADNKGRNFIGLMGELSVYETPTLAPTEGILYDKKHVKVRKNPMAIEFENYINPKMLYLSEDLVAWSVEEGAVAKIVLKEN